VIPEGINTERDASLVESYEFKFRQLLAGFAKRPASRVRFALHPRLPVLVSSSSDHSLTAINYSTK